MRKGAAVKKTDGMSERQMLEEIWAWTYGNGRPGAEKRIADLEQRQLVNATREDVGCIDLDIKRRVEYVESRLESRIEALSHQITLKAVIEIAVIVGTLVGLFIFGGG